MSLGYFQDFAVSSRRQFGPTFQHDAFWKMVESSWKQSIATYETHFLAHHHSTESKQGKHFLDPIDEEKKSQLVKEVPYFFEWLKPKKKSRC